MGLLMLVTGSRIIRKAKENGPDLITKLTLDNGKTIKQMGMASSINTSLESTISLKVNGKISLVRAQNNGKISRHAHN